MEFMEYLDYSMRYLHLIVGIVWIGMLYYFNFCSGPYLAAADKNAKVSAVANLMPHVAAWFRWGALFTFLTGAYLLHMVWSNGTLKEDTIIAGVMATIMAINVWFIIWPNQRIMIESHRQMERGEEADPNAADAAATVLLASRTNTLLSIPMAAMMVSSAHFAFGSSITAESWGMYIVLGLVVIVWLNGLFGSLNPLIKSIPAVIISGFVLTGITQVLLHFL